MLSAIPSILICVNETSVVKSPLLPVHAVVILLNWGLIYPSLYILSEVFVLFLYLPYNIETYFNKYKDFHIFSYCFSSSQSSFSLTFEILLLFLLSFFFLQEFMDRCKFIVLILRCLGHIWELMLLLAMKGGILAKYIFKY